MHRQILRCNLSHALFDGGEIVGAERALVSEVVVETVVDDGAYRHLSIGKQFFDGIAEQVRRRMANHLQAIRIFIGDDAQRCIVVDQRGGVLQFAVHLARERCLGQARPNARGDIGNGNRLLEFFLATVGKSDYRHCGILKKVVGASGIEPLTTTMSR